MLNLTSPTTRFMVVRGGCFGVAFATVAFTPGDISALEAQEAMGREHPDLFQGSECESCGYDYPDFAENNDVDREPESIHRHSPESCGQEEGYMEDDRFYRALYYSTLNASDEVEYMERLGEQYPDVATDAPRGDTRALESWIADREGCYPSEDCGYNLTYSLDDILNDEDASRAAFYSLERGEGGAITVEEHLVSPLASM